MSDNAQQSCACNTAPKLIFPCSGAADVGEVADRAQRVGYRLEQLLAR